MADGKNKSGGMFARIETRDDAVNVATDCGNGFFVIAAIQAGIGAFIAPSMLIDAATFAACGYFVRAKHSRTAAVVALLLSSVALLSTFMNMMGQSVGGGKNVILAIIIAIAAARAVEATFKLNGRFKTAPTVPGAPNPPMQTDGAPRSG